MASNSSFKKSSFVSTATKNKILQKMLKILTQVHFSAEEARNKEKLGCYPDKLVSTRFYQTAEFSSINSTKSPNHPILIRFPLCL